MFGFLKETPITISESLWLSILGMLIVFVVLILLSVIIYLTGKAGHTKEKIGTVKETGTIKNEIENITGGDIKFLQKETALKLVNVDEKTAAIIMAIVADYSKTAIENLSFKSIRLLEENK